MFSVFGTVLCVSAIIVLRQKKTGYFEKTVRYRGATVFHLEGIFLSL